MSKKVNNYFFSIVIPTYNPREYIPRLLKSITQNACLDKIEVIISDDCSTDTFDDVLEQFSNINFLKICNKKHSSFPRDGRQNGMDNAHGKWIAFADQDDYFIENSFDKLMSFIENNNAQNIIVSNFIEQSSETGNEIIRTKDSGWTHGKLYEKEFLEKYDIKYDEINYCEDINLTNKIDCVLTINQIVPFEFKEYFYVWLRRKDSLSDIEYFRQSMPDYINATLGVIIESIDKNVDNTNVIGILNVKFIIALLHVYFYYQSRQLYGDKQGLIRSLAVLQPIYSRFKLITGFGNEDIIGFVHNDLIMVYEQTRTGDFNQIPFIEQVSFVDWMRLYLD